MENIKKISLIIPMAGEGSRFKADGFESYKPFLRLAGKSMIEGVIQPFESLSELFILTTDSILKSNQKYFDNLLDRVKVIIIPEHKLGPAYSIFLAQNLLPRNRAYAIAYCDVWWSSKELNLIKLLDYEAVIFVHRGFHPHLVADNFSAFCSETIQNSGTLLEIREKGSFTDDWMNEPVSVGVFFVRDSELLFSSIEKMVLANDRVAGEFYPSIIFNELIKLGIDVKLIDVEAYIHIGVPSQFRDVQFWSEIVNEDDSNAPTNKQLNCMLVGGSGSRMKGVSEVPKHILPVKGLAMLDFVAKKFNCQKNIVIGAPNFISTPMQNMTCQVVTLQDKTKSHLETLIKSIEYLPNDKSILFTSCDCYGEVDWTVFNRLVQDLNSDCATFSFEKSLLHKKNKQQHTTIKIDNNLVVDVDIKSKNKSYSSGLAGFFWFRNTSVIKDLLMSIHLLDVQEELLVDHLVLLMSIGNNKPACYQLKSYIHLGTPDEYNEFKYWHGRGSELISL
jgi:molybdopterin-guanine dinucleotide biosynthesis protein A